MYPHRIRLRGPWEAEAQDDAETGPKRVTMPSDLHDAGWPGFSGKVRLVRKFGYPGRIDAFERVWLTFAEVKGHADIVLNGQPVGAVRSVASEFDVTKFLAARNRLEVTLDADSDQCGLTGEVALEIRCAAYLADVGVSAKSMNILVHGRVLGEWPKPLDLYVLVDGRNTHYASVCTSANGTPFQVVVPEAGQVIRVDLVQGPLVWYRVDLAHPACAADARERS